MPDVINLTCPNCGGRLSITEDIDRFSCAYCGAEQIVKRGNGIVSLKPVIDEISKGVENTAKDVGKTAAELAIARLDREIKDVQSQKDKLEEKINQGIFVKFASCLGIPLIILGIYLLIIFRDSLLCMSMPIILIIIGIHLTLHLLSSQDDDRYKLNKLNTKLEDLKKQKRILRKKLN